MFEFKNGEVNITDLDAAATLSSDELQEQAARFKRNNLIALTDHHSLSDRTMSDEIRIYRQALRDAPDHEDWPYLEEGGWPTKPE